jgi:outer membrane protein TolC
LNNDVNQQNLNVQLYQLRDRINQLFFGILYLDEQLRQLELVKQDISLGIKTVEALVNNGVAFKSNLNLLKAELLQADQHGIEMRTSRKGLLDILSLFVNQPLPENTQLEKPVAQIPAMDININRPELNLFAAQQKQLQGRLNLYDAGKKPRASFFFQGGYGRPGLNALLNQFKSYYITGIRLTWNLGWIYTHKKEIQLLGFAQQSVNVQKDVFLFNTNTQLKQQQTEIEKLQKLISMDKEIIDLRTGVKEAAKAQLENGVITSIDYLKELNEEDRARQDLITHQVQLLQAQVNYQTISGKQ